MIQIDMSMPEKCSDCIFCDDNCSCVASDYNGIGINVGCAYRSGRRDIRCPLKEQEAELQKGRYYSEVFDIGYKAGKESIVRCRDCIHATMTSDGKMCKYCAMDTDDFGDQRTVYHDADWFCADGKRRE